VIFIVELPWVAFVADHAVEEAYRIGHGVVPLACVRWTMNQ